MRTKEIIFDRKANTGLKLYLQEELFEFQTIEKTSVYFSDSWGWVFFL
ncbi:hypothetical protein SE1_00655 [Enterococcus hirae EnGen0127]|nr:hypothetical protein SE1_00655 [Enterococcus hirae EnGen0127]